MQLVSKMMLTVMIVKILASTLLGDVAHQV